MNHQPTLRILLAATTGLAFSAIAAQAQLFVDVQQQGTWGPFVGGVNNFVTNNGSYNTAQVITTGTPLANPFSITYQPFFGPNVVTLGTGTLNTATFVFDSPTTPLDYFYSVEVLLATDFDNDSIVDLTQSYTIQLTPFVSPNNLTGVNYQIIPNEYYGNVAINGVLYGYATVVANSVGTLFDGSNTSAALQFKFLPTLVPDLTPVPEPSTYALAGVLALGGIILFRRRRAIAGKAA
jgi:hypothetical protein